MRSSRRVDALLGRQDRSHEPPDSAMGLRDARKSKIEAEKRPVSTCIHRVHRSLSPHRMPLLGLLQVTRHGWHDLVSAGLVNPVHSVLCHLKAGSRKVGE